MSETSGRQREGTREESREGAREQVREQARAQARERTADDLRRRRALVFGEVLPESTRDDLPGQERADASRPAVASQRSPEPRPDAGPDGGFDDEWWRSQVPPHHG